MKTIKPKVYQTGNSWQKKVYKKMADFLDSKLGIKEFGKSSKGNQYKHLLTTEQAEYNFITKDIYDTTKERFEKHKAGDLNRILTNTAASQAYCFNLVIYLNQNKHLANKLFSSLLKKDVDVQHIDPEFTPNHCENIDKFERNMDESIGDQNLKSGIGTDADIAVFYNYNNYKKGVILIEFKFIEAEFSVCSSFTGPKKRNKKETEKEKQERIKRKIEIQAICNSNNFFNEMVESKHKFCGYNKYFNWELTSKSKVIDAQKIKLTSVCPFRFGLNQLWRNMLLAEQVAIARQCDEFGFWVFSPSENREYLWKKGEIEKEFRNILTDQGNERFRYVSLESILDKLQEMVTEENDINWLRKMNEKYRI